MMMQNTSIICNDILETFFLERFDCFFFKCQAWSSAAQFQQAYGIGKGEAQAAKNLLLHIDPRIVAKLKDLVQYPSTITLMVLISSKDS